jgi:threonine aldolase
MCNQIGIRLHVRPGEAVLLHRTSHPIVAEAGGAAAHGGAMISALDGEGGMFGPDDVDRALTRPGDRYAATARLLCVEQTTNMGGGRVWPLQTLREVLDLAHEHGLRAHLDGARLLNAVVASSVSAAEYASGFDTAWLDFTKGLGAPVGACLAGSQELIDEAWRYKQMWGGAMRQAGILAAAGLYALDHHVDRLAEDHANARHLADGLAELPGVRLDASRVETNIVIFAVDDAAGLEAALAADGVDVSRLDAQRIRMVTHLDVDRAGCERALDAVRAALAD